MPCPTQQDCVVDRKLEHKSDLIAVTSNLDYHWYSVIDNDGEVSSAEDQTASVEMELLAVLKRAELSTKLRKLDFREFKA